MTISNPSHWKEPLYSGKVGSPKYDKIVAMIAIINANESLVNTHASRHEDGGGDEIVVTDLSGLLGDAQTPLVHEHSTQDLSLGGFDLYNVSEIRGYLDPEHKIVFDPVTNEIHVYAGDEPGDEYLIIRGDNTSDYPKLLPPTTEYGMLGDAANTWKYGYIKNLFVDGAVIKDVTPSARVYRNSNQSISYATWTNLLFNVERWDNDTIHDTGSNTDRLTCKTAGVYSIFVTAGFEVIASGDYHMILMLNGSTILSQKVFPNCVGGHAVGMDLGSQYSLAVNDYVTAQVYWWCSGCSSTRNILYTAEYSPEFMMTRLGAV